MTANEKIKSSGQQYNPPLKPSVPLLVNNITRH